MESSKKKELSFGIIFSYITIAVQCLSGIMYTPIILHSLGQGEYGIYSLCTSFSGYLTIFNAGMNAAVVRFYVQERTKSYSKISELNSIFFRVFIVLAVLSLLLGLFFSWNAETFFGNNITEQEYIIFKQLFCILALITFVTVINCFFSSLVIANEKFIFAKAINLIQIILAPILTIPLLFNGYGSIAIFHIKLFLIILVTIFNAYYCLCKLKIKFKFGNVDFKLLKSILIFAGSITIQSMMDQLNWQIDKFILAWTSGSAEISIYSVGSTLNSYYIMLSSAMASVFVAEINRLVVLKKDREISNLFVKTSRIFALFVLLIISGYCVFGKAFILIWAGVEYDASYYVGLLLMLPVTVSLTMGLGQDIARAKNVHKKQIFINMVVSLCNFVISVPFAIRFGAIGSALGTFICEIIICVIIQSIYYNNVVKLNMKEYFKEMLRVLRGLVIPVLYGITILRFNLVKDNFSSIAAYGLIYILVYGVSMWGTVMTSYEKELLLKIICKALNFNHKNRK